MNSLYAKAQAGTLRRMVGGAFLKLTGKLRENRDIRRLENLDDCELRDLGITRGSIRYSVRHGRRG